MKNETNQPGSGLPEPNQTPEVPATETPTSVIPEAPAVQTPAPEAPIAETSAPVTPEVPAVESPTPEVLVAETPASVIPEAPAVQTPTPEVPAAETPAWTESQPVPPSGEQPPVYQAPTTDAPQQPEMYPIPDAQGAAVQTKRKLSGGGIAIVVLLIVALLVGGFFLLRGPIGSFIAKRQIKSDPLAAMIRASNLTTEKIEAAPSTLPNMEPFMDAPVEQNVEVFFDQLPSDAYGSTDFLQNSSFSFRTQSDMKNKQAAFDLAVDTPYFSLEDSSLFISPELVALSLPTFYSDHAYITLDPDTFVQDWNTSPYADMIGDFPAWIQPATLIDGFFSYSEEMNQMSTSLLQEDGEFVQRIEEISKTLQSKMTVTFEGEDDSSYKLLAVIPAVAMEEALYSFADVVEDFSYDFFQAMLTNPFMNAMDEEDYADDMMEDFMSSIEEGTDFFRELVFVSDANVQVLIDKKALTLREVKMDRLGVKMYDTDNIIDLSLLLTYGDTANPMDNMSLDLYLEPADRDYADDSLSFHITRKGSDTPGVLGADWNFEFVDDYGDSYVFFLDYTWDKAGDGHMEATFGFEDYYYEELMEVVLDGYLSEGKEGLVLKDGALTVYDDRETLFSLGLDYSMSIIPPKSFTPDLKDSIDFFDLDMEQILNTLFGYA